MQNFKLYIVIIVCFLSPQLIKSQEPGPIKVLQEENLHGLPTALDYEKVYLHVDRDYYATGDDVWFKAYLVNAFDNRLTDHSKCLYVELISPESKIVDREAVVIVNGTACGDFHLKDSLASGQYILRAYTGWMENFEDYFFFKKSIRVENVSGVIRPELIRKVTKNTEPELDVEFFPEGGSLVENVYSTVGVKAVGGNGKGCNVKGIVFSDSGDTVAVFKTIHLGMGRFTFVPKEGMGYYAVGKADNGQTFKVRLPDALKEGYTLKLLNQDSTVMWLGIRTNMRTFQRDSGREMRLVGTVRGTVCLTANIINRSVVNYLNIPQEKLPEGIIRLTLYDHENKPQCERLAFIRHRLEPIIQIVSGKKNYAPHEKTELKISVRDSLNHPLAANLSVAVVDHRQRESKGEVSNIYSSLMLESEIKGKIEEPARYFDPNNPDRLIDMDALLLTQGWRDFIWKYLTAPTLKIKHSLEKGIYISGYLRRLLTDKPIANANISLLMSDKEKSGFMEVVPTDSTGRYSFGPLFFFGEQNLILSAANQKNRAVGAISLDSVLGVPPVLPRDTLEEIRNSGTDFLKMKEVAEVRYNSNHRYTLKDNIPLSEVVVTTKKEKEKEDGHSRIYGTPDFSMQLTDKDLSYSDVFQLLQGRVAGLFISGGYPNINISIRGARQNPLFLLDGAPIGIEEVASLPLSIIDKVEVLKDAGNLAVFGIRGANGVISIFTKTGTERTGNSLNYHSINTKVSGFYQSRMFYSPKYDSVSQKQEKPDLRATIFWQPNVITDQGGNATVSFYNPDNATSVDILVEGVSLAGDPLTSEGHYQIDIAR